MNWHAEVLGTRQEKVLKRIGPLMDRWNFYLAGGTAIALHLGHRHSVDLDWFTGEGITDPLRLARDLEEEGIPFATGQIGRGALHGTVSGVRISLLGYRYPLLKPLVPWPACGCSLASLDDLAGMKLSALAQRGAKKDFADLYALGVKHCSLEEILGLYQKKFSIQDIGHLLYSLAYFDDADRERLPRMLWDTDWRIIRETIQEWVKELGGSKP